ncbi:MAG: DUF3857 domain-containing protein, partial [Planctomycetota bacterium]
MRYLKMLLLISALFLIAAGEPPETPPDAPPDTPGKKDTAEGIDRFGDIKPLERKALSVESRGNYAEAISIYWDCLAESVMAAQTADGENKLFEIAMQEFFVEKATCLTDDLHNKPMNNKKLEEALKLDGIDPHVKGRILYELMLSVGAAGDMKRVAETRDKLGIITKWAFIGPFDNERGRGFNEKYGPEKSLEIEKKEGDTAHKVWYDGKVRKVAWRMMPFDDPFGIINLDALLRPNDQVLAYALAFVNSDKEQEAAVRLASDEGCIVWVNGKEVIKEDIERQMEFDQNSAAVCLAKGWNSILVKIAEHDDTWEFRLRLTTPEGGPLTTIRQAQDLKQIAELALNPAPETAEPAKRLAKGAIEIFDTLLKSHERSPWLYFRKAYLINDRHPYDIHDFSGRDCMKKACDLDPTVPDFWYYLGHAETRYVREESEREWNPRRIAYQKVVELDPNYTEAYAALSSHYYILGFYRKALEYAKATRKANPDYFSGIEYELRVLSHFGFDMEEKIRMRDLYRSGRFPMEPAVIKYEIGRRMERRDLEGAAKLQRDLIAMNAIDPEPWLALAEIAAVRARTPDKYPDAEGEILHIYDTLLEQNPYGLNVYNMRASFHEARDRFHDALKSIEQALEITPEDEILLKRRGDILWRIAVEENDEDVKKKALDAWRRMLEINPNDFELKRRLAFLEETSHYEDDPRFDEDVEALIASVPEDLGNENDPYAYVLRKRITKVYKEGYYDDAIHEVIKILNEAGVKQFEYYSAGHGFVNTGGRQVRFKRFKITHADGSPGPAVRIGERSWINLPRLQIGDLLEVKYRVEDARGSGFRILMENYFGEIFPLQADVPILNEKLILMLPRDREFYINARNMPEEPDSTEEMEGGGRM